MTQFRFGSVRQQTNETSNSPSGVSRRTFLSGAAAVAGAAALPIGSVVSAAGAASAAGVASAAGAAGMAAAAGGVVIDPIKRSGPSRLKVGLAAYSMRDFLQAKPPEKPKMDLLGFVDWAATLDTDSVELTSYFFPDPVTPEFLLELKRRCHLNGLDISGGAIRNNFTLPPGEELENWFKHLDKWLDYYSILGAPVIRVFAGIPPKGVTEEQGIQNAITNMNRACEMASKKGVILGLENHDYLTKIDRLVPIIKAVNSPWFGVNFDSGNVDSDNPYPELAKIAPYAVNVQLKVDVGPAKAKVPTDVPRVVKLLKDAGFRGYIVLEYEAKPDPYTAIPKHLAELRAAIAAAS